LYVIWSRNCFLNHVIEEKIKEKYKWREDGEEAAAGCP
jgi:hypothetical protein